MTHSPISVVGSINSDVSYHVAELPRPGETILSTNRFDAPGGKGANQAAALAALGHPVAFIGCVGEDTRGTDLVAHLTGLGIDCSAVSTSATSPTGSATIVVSDDGENSIVVHPGANHDVTADQVTAALAATNGDFVMVQFEVPLEAALATTSGASRRVVVNPAPMPPASETLWAIIHGADIVVPNRTELAELARRPLPTTPNDVIDCVKQLDIGAQVVVTLGAEGALVFPDGPTGDAVSVSAPQVNTVDSSGAGDAFCAALVAALNVGHPLVAAAEYACEFAAWTTTLDGAQVTIPAPEALALPAVSSEPAR